MVQERKENSIIFGSGEEKEVQKILTLSTCIGDGSSSQRLAVHAAVEMILQQNLEGRGFCARIRQNQKTYDTEQEKGWR